LPEEGSSRFLNPSKTAHFPVSGNLDFGRLSQAYQEKIHDILSHIFALLQPVGSLFGLQKGEIFLIFISNMGQDFSYTKIHLLLGWQK
jgi:hypothetical protein